MITPGFVGSLAYRVIAWALVVAMTSTSSIPIIQRVRVAADAYAALMRRLGGLNPTLDAITSALPTDLQDTLAPRHTLNAPRHTLPASRATLDDSPPPLSVSRIASTYTPAGLISGTLAVTFTIYNNRPPTLMPEVSASATITEAAAALESFDATSDPNAVHHVLLVDSFTAHATHLSSEPRPDRVPYPFWGGAGGVLVWNLGSVAPMKSITATLSISVPTSVASLIELDAGAVAWGTAAGKPVRAQARPVTLGPETSGACVFPTVEADPADPYVLRRAAQLGQEPLAMFEYVRSLEHEVYAGSLRGARGAEWSMGGNALDKSSLLIALLRGVGIDARYRHGTLSDERARELILSMFPATGAVVGYVPEGVPLSDPANDPELLAEARDHWWVEAQVDGEWVDLDPSFGYAEAGQTFAVPEGAPVCEPADSLRHKVTVSVEAENYHMLNYIQGGFGYTTVLTHTFTTAELVGEPLTLEHLVAYESPPCMIFCWTRYTYVPYLRLGDQQTIIRGEPFWEMLSNFPFGQWAATAEWIHSDVQNPAGEVTRYTRQVADRLRIGPQGGPLREPKAVQSLMTAEVLSSLGPGIPSLVHEADSHTIYFNPSWMSEEYAAHVGDDLLVATPRIAEVASLAVGLGDLQSILAGGYQPPLDAVELAEVNEVVEGTTQAFDRVMGATFVTMSDWAAQDLAETGQVAVYPDAPRITIASSVVQQSHVVTETRQLQMLDLLHDGLRVIAYPGQAQGAERIYRMTRGVCNTFLESAVGEELTGEWSKSAANVLQAALDQRIPLAYVDAEHLDVLNEVAIPTQAKAFILDTVLRGYAVLVPERMVEWFGEQAIAWWQLDLETGEMVGVGEDGTHFFLIVFAVFMAAVFLPMILLLLHLVTLLLRLLVWRWAAEETWRYFWREAVAGAEGGRSQEIYQDALNRTKSHMKKLRWLVPFVFW